MTRGLVALLLASGIIASCGGHTGDALGQGSNAGAGGSSASSASGGRSSGGSVDRPPAEMATGGVSGFSTGGAPSTCVESRDCKLNEACVVTGQGRVCLLRPGLCRTNDDCTKPKICTPQGECQHLCTSDSSCEAGQVCYFGMCGYLPPGSGGAGSGGAASGGAASGGASPVEAGVVDAGTPDAGRCALPLSPVYACAQGSTETEGCPPADGLDAGSGNYPIGCVVKLPKPDGITRCGPQKCTCTRDPQSSGVATSTWLCPL